MCWRRCIFGGSRCFGEDVSVRGNGNAVGLEQMHFSLVECGTHAAPYSLVARRDSNVNAVTTQSAK